MTAEQQSVLDRKIDKWIRQKLLGFPRNQQETEFINDPSVTFSFVDEFHEAFSYSDYTYEDASWDLQVWSCREGEDSATMYGKIVMSKEQGSLREMLSEIFNTPD